MALTKILNDENKSFQPVLTDKLVYDTKPTVNSFNGITSDAVARAIAGASGEVPAVEEGDNGKILTAIYDEGGAAVEWADAPSGIPDMTSQDGKILGAVDNGGTMEAQWISKPVSNVTTSDKQFVVGVNGSGKPITVDCANATTVGSSATFTENGTYTTFMDKPSVLFPLAHLDPCSLGSGTATLTIPEDITYDTSTSGMGISSVNCCYWNGSQPGPNCTISESIYTTGKIKAGTYTLTGANSAASYGWDDGIIIWLQASGYPAALDAFLAAFSEAVQSWTLSYTASEVTGYSITPAVLPTVTGNSGKVLTVNSGATGVEWANVPNELPSVTGNAGKVLTVNSGATGVEWATAQGGGIEAFYITSTTTNNEIYQAYKAGKFLYYQPSTNAEWIPMTMGLNSQTSNWIIYEIQGSYAKTYYASYAAARFNVYSGEIKVAVSTDQADSNAFTTTYKTLTAVNTPIANTSTDVGKVLTITANGPAWVTPS